MKKILMTAMFVSMLCIGGQGRAEIEQAGQGQGIAGVRSSLENKDAVAERIEYRTDNGPATESVMTNQTGRIFATVSNKGNMRIDGLKTRITVDGQTVREDDLTMMPNGSQELIWVYNFTNPGRHVIALLVDNPENRIYEVNENNNRIEKTITASAPVYGFVASALECNIAGGARNVSSAHQGDQAEITGTVTNNGDTSVMRVKIALILDGTPLRDATIALEPGRTATLTSARALNAPGRHTIVFSVDTDNAFQEANEGDNRIEKTIDVIANAPAGNAAGTSSSSGSGSASTYSAGGWSSGGSGGRTLWKR